MNRAILVTGASGFVGQALLGRLAERPDTLVALTRSLRTDLPARVIQRIAGPIESLDEEGWLTNLEGIDTIVHLAAIAHIGPGVPEDAYDAVNHRAVARMGAAAVKAGVRRVVFLSSVRAQTGASAPLPFDETTPPSPTDAYGRAKLAAERALAALPLETVILRPALIVGAPPKGNLALLLKFAATGLPLPLASLSAPRSAISLADVAEIVLRALDEPEMAGGTFILADPEPLTPGAMIAALRQGLGMGPRLVACPPALLRLPFAMTGRADMFERLAGALVARPEALIRLGWQPRKPVLRALEELGAQHRCAGQKSESPR